MKLSTRSRYGVRMMVGLAIHYGKGPLLLRVIAENQDISEKYLSQLIIPLKAAGFVDSTRGAHGGYTLAKQPDEISLKDIVEVLEGDLSLVGCVRRSSICNRASFCVTRDVWAQVESNIKDTLSSYTLRDMINRHNEKKDNLVMYNI